MRGDRADVPDADRRGPGAARRERGAAVRRGHGGDRALGERQVVPAPAHRRGRPPERRHDLRRRSRDRPGLGTRAAPPAARRGRLRVPAALGQLPRRPDGPGAPSVGGRQGAARRAAHGHPRGSRDRPPRPAPALGAVRRRAAARRVRPGAGDGGARGGGRRADGGAGFGLGRVHPRTAARARSRGRDVRDRHARPGRDRGRRPRDLSRPRPREPRDPRPPEVARDGDRARRRDAALDAGGSARLGGGGGARAGGEPDGGHQDLRPRGRGRPRVEGGEPVGLARRDRGARGPVRDRARRRC